MYEFQFSALMPFFYNIHNIHHILVSSFFFFIIPSIHGQVGDGDFNSLLMKKIHIEIIVFSQWTDLTWTCISLLELIEFLDYMWEWEGVYVDVLHTITMSAYTTSLISSEILIV